MKVAYCITNLEVGGAEIVLAELLARLPERVEPRVYTLIDGGPVQARIRALGVEVHGLGMRRGMPSVGAYRRLRKHLAAFAPDVVHTWLYHADLLGGLAARSVGAERVVWHLHNNDLSAARVRPLTRLVVRACAGLSRRVPDRIICCGESVRATHVARGYESGRMVVIPNGVDVDAFRPDPSAGPAIRAEFGIDRTRPLIAFVARLDPQKGHAAFFRAVARYQELGGDAHFLLAGRGVDDANAELVSWRGVVPDPGRVTLAGPRPDVARLFAASDVATWASLGEAFPVAVLEAMACETPCVVTDVGDCAAMVGDTGTVVPPADPEALAREWLNMLALSAEERHALGAGARQRVIERFAVGTMVERITALYDELTFG